jgi:hypothetical protein
VLLSLLQVLFHTALAIHAPSPSTSPTTQIVGEVAHMHDGPELGQDGMLGKSLKADFGDRAEHVNMNRDL